MTRAPVFTSLYRQSATCDLVALFFGLNLKSLILMNQIVVPYLKEGAKIINVGSLSSFEPVPHLSVYAATKAGV
jgi:short-subunit dehydrogenase